MIAFGPDTDVPATPLQRAARKVLVGGCAVLGIGVISSVVRLAMLPTAAQAMLAAPRLRLVAQDQFSAMAAGGTAAAPRAVAPAAKPPRETPAVVAKDRVVWMLVTAYCPCPLCCGSNASGLTASGKPTSANYGHFVAAPGEFAFGSRVTVPGYNQGKPVPVYDRGGAIKGNRLDVFFASHDRAKAWGRRWVQVTVAGG